jgi:hypothetical protein
VSECAHTIRTPEAPPRLGPAMKPARHNNSLQRTPKSRVPSSDPFDSKYGVVQTPTADGRR